MALTTASISPTKVGPNSTGQLTDLVVSSNQAAQAGGDAYRVQGKEVLVINNAGGAPITATLKSVASNFGIVAAANDITLVVGAGKIGVQGPLSAGLYADANGLVQVTYSAVTSVTIGLFAFATTA